MSSGERTASRYVGMEIYRGISPSVTCSQLSPSFLACWSAVYRFQVEKFRCLLPSWTSVTSQETGAALLYQGQTVSLEWQSEQARRRLARTFAGAGTRWKEGRVCNSAPVSNLVIGITSVSRPRTRP